MTDTRSATGAPTCAGDRRRLRITLLSVAVAILVLGATAASVCGYAAFAHLR